LIVDSEGYAVETTVAAKAEPVEEASSSEKGDENEEEVS